VNEKKIMKENAPLPFTLLCCKNMPKNDEVIYIEKKGSKRFMGFSGL